MAKMEKLETIRPSDNAPCKQQPKARKTGSKVIPNGKVE
jgi:hypothetical protein